MSIVQAIIGSIAGGRPPTIYMNSYPGSINEGSSGTFQFYYENYPNTTVYWRVVNGTTSSDDWAGGATPGGSFNISGQGYDGFTISLAGDATSESTEYATVQISLGDPYFNSPWFDYQISLYNVAPTNDFTIEWWQNMDNTQVSGYPRLFDVGSWNTENPGISFESGSIYLWGGGTNDSVSATYNTKGSWVHWCMERHINQMKFYKNGTNILSSNNLGAAQINDTVHQLTLGMGSGSYWNGKITDFHWVKGTAKYQGNFAVPTSPITALPNTKLLLNATSDGNKFVDATGNHTHSSLTNGGATFSTDTPYGGTSNGSLVFSTSGIVYANSTDWAFDA